MTLALRNFSTPIEMVEEFHDAFGQDTHFEPLVPSPEIIQLRRELITEEYKETMAAFDLLEAAGSRVSMREALIELADGLADLQYVINGGALAHGIKLDDVFDEVHRSNMSKVNPDGTVTYSASGKVLKPETYSPADIRSILFPPNGHR